MYYSCYFDHGEVEENTLDTTSHAAPPTFITVTNILRCLSAATVGAGVGAAAGAGAASGPQQSGGPSPHAEKWCGALSACEDVVLRSFSISQAMLWVTIN